MQATMSGIYSKQYGFLFLLTYIKSFRKNKLTKVSLLNLYKGSSLIYFRAPFRSPKEYGTVVRRIPERAPTFENYPSKAGPRKA